MRNPFLLEIPAPVVRELPVFGTVLVESPPFRVVSVAESIITTLAQWQMTGMPPRIAMNLCVGCGNPVGATHLYCIPCAWAKSKGFLPPLEAQAEAMGALQGLLSRFHGDEEHCQECDGECDHCK